MAWTRDIAASTRWRGMMAWTRDIAASAVREG